MATLTERLQFLVTLDADDAIKGFNQIGRTADRELGKVEKSTERMQANIKKGSAGLLAFSAVGIAGLTKMADKAGDLAEAQNKANEIFGDSVDVVNEFAEGSAEATGLSERAALDAAATFGQYADAAGLAGKESANFSTDLVQLAADLGSFNNMPTADVARDIQAGFNGSVESLRKYGVFLDEASLKQAAANLGIYDGTGVLTSQQKILAANAILWESTAKAQGDFARTSDGLANSQKILSAELENLQASLGATFAPILAGIVQHATGAVQAFTDLNEATGGLVGQLGTFAILGAGALGMLGFLTNAAISAAGGLQALGGAMKAAAGSAGLLSAAFVPAAIVGFTVVLPIAAGLLAAYSRDATDAEETQQRLNEAFDEGKLTAEELAAALPRITFEGLLDDETLERLNATNVTLDDLFSLIQTSPDLIDVLGGNALNSVLTDTNLTLEQVKFHLEDIGAMDIPVIEDMFKAVERGEASRADLAQFVKDLDSARVALEETMEAQQDKLESDIAAAEFAKVLTGAQADQLETLVAQAKTLPELAAAREILVAAEKEAAKAQKGETDAALENIEAQTELGGQYEDLAGFREDAVEDSKAVEDALKAEVDAAQNAADTTEALADVFKSRAKDPKVFADAVDATARHLDAVMAGVSVADDIRAVGEAFTEAIQPDETTGAVAAFVKPFDEASEAFRELDSAVVASGDSIRERINLMAEQGSSEEDIVTILEAHKQGLFDQMVQSGLSEEAAQAYIDTLNLTPETVHTAVELQVQAQQLAQVENLLALMELLENDGLPREARISVLTVLAAQGPEAALAEAEFQLAALGPPEIAAELGLDIVPATKGRQTFVKDTAKVTPEENALHMGLNSLPAQEDRRDFINATSDMPPGQRPRLPTQANMEPAEADADAFIAKVDNLPESAQPSIDTQADTSAARTQADDAVGDIDAMSASIAVGADTSEMERKVNAAIDRLRRRFGNIFGGTGSVPSTPGAIPVMATAAAGADSPNLLAEDTAGSSYGLYRRPDRVSAVAPATVINVTQYLPAGTDPAAVITALRRAERRNGSVTTRLVVAPTRFGSI